MFTQLLNNIRATFDEQIVVKWKSRSIFYTLFVFQNVLSRNVF